MQTEKSFNELSTEKSKLIAKLNCSELDQERVEDKLQTMKLTASHNTSTSNKISEDKNREDPASLDKNRCEGQKKPQDNMPGYNTDGIGY